jgi:predicted RNA-binding protein YlqC (UPF0109 family)
MELWVDHRAWIVHPMITRSGLSNERCALHGTVQQGTSSRRTAVTDETQVMGVRELVENIARAIVDQPERVICRETRGVQSCILELEVAPEDVGKVIGRKGIHADAIRRIVNAIGGKHKIRYVLEIIEN